LAARRAGTAWWVATALLGALTARLLVLSLVEITACRALWPEYMCPAYPLLLVFILVVPVSVPLSLRPFRSPGIQA
jgi:hypothetical protein